MSRHDRTIRLQPDAPQKKRDRRSIRIRAMYTLAMLSLCVMICRVEETAGQPSDRPNVLFILADDLGWADLGSYGNTFIDTPNLDRLAREGMRFTDAYAASPVCSPTRASIQTGLYPARFDLNDIINPHRRPWALLSPPENGWRLPPDAVTLAEALKEAGYTSTLVGKWNVGYDKPDMPEDRGYVAPPSADSEPNRAYREDLERFARENPHKGTGPITLQAVRFMEEHRDGPFLAFVSYNAPHIETAAREELIGKYERRKTEVKTDIHAEYAAMVTALDEGVGYLLRSLEVLDIDDRTLVFFFSDNGGLIQVYHHAGPIITTNAPLRGEKGTLYEGGIRVPLIVRIPGMVKPGAVSAEQVISNDFFPTFLEAAGLPIPSDLDGVSLWPVLSGRGPLNREALYWHYPSYHHSTPAAAVRVGRYKLIEFYEDGRRELYDLATDPGERLDLAAERPEMARSLAERLHVWQKRVGAGMPRPNPDFDPSKAYLWGNRPAAPWEKAPEGVVDMRSECIKLFGLHE